MAKKCTCSKCETFWVAFISFLYYVYNVLYGIESVELYIQMIQFHSMGQQLQLTLRKGKRVLKGYVQGIDEDIDEHKAMCRLCISERVSLKWCRPKCNKGL